MAIVTTRTGVNKRKPLLTPRSYLLIAPCSPAGNQVRPPARVGGTWTRSFPHSTGVSPSNVRPIRYSSRYQRTSSVGYGIDLTAIGLVAERAHETSRTGSSLSESESESASSPWAVFSQKDGVTTSCHIAFIAAMDIITQ